MRWKARPGSGLRDASHRFGVDPAIHLDHRSWNQGAEPPDLVGGGRDERLAAPARVDGHAEDQVGGAVQLADGLGGGAGVDGHPGEAAGVADRAQRPVDVGVGLQVRGDAVGAGAGELLHVLRGAVDHQVDVDGAAGVVHLVGDRCGGERAHGDRRDEVPVHDIDMDDPGAGIHHLGDLGAEPREVRRQDRRCHVTPAE
jgi:hypothetical protein